MLVTINTDASYDHDLKIGAYAFWIVSDGFRVKQGGVFKKECNCSTDAEAKCILNAIYALGTKEGHISKVIINTDSLLAIDIFTKDSNHLGKRMRRNRKHWKYLHNKLRKLKRKVPGSFEVEFRHVKAHSGINDKRSFVNEWCDKTAKYFLRIERNKPSK